MRRGSIANNPVRSLAVEVYLFIYYEPPNEISVVGEEICGAGYKAGAVMVILGVCTEVGTESAAQH